MTPAARVGEGGGSPSAPFTRLWQGFMTGRVAFAAVIFILQLSLYSFGVFARRLPLAVCMAYVMLAVAYRVLATPPQRGRAFDRHWPATAGVDILVFGWLQYIQGATVNYSPLLALAVLIAAVLGTVTTGLATAALVTLVLLANAVLPAWTGNLVDNTPALVQAALTGAGFFVVAILANQLAVRLSREEALAVKGSQAAALEQRVSQTVMETLDDGVVVIGANGQARAVNPAAWRLLMPETLALQGAGLDAARLAEFSHSAACRALATLAAPVLDGSEAAAAPMEVLVPVQGEGAVRMQVRIQVVQARAPFDERVCLMHLEDLRAIEARIRAEKMIALGRMSTAVAHEIRNPLAAIVQANALLGEDLTDPGQARLSQLIGQNAARLSAVVDDVLELARAAPLPRIGDPCLPGVGAAVAAWCSEWGTQNNQGARLAWHSGIPEDATARFDAEHLRRVVVNLLDNAARHASAAPGAITVYLRAIAGDRLRLAVWSDGTAISPAVEKHLFEPFFSSESRSTGLGLFICRELCERHGATLAYERRALDGAGRGARLRDGNEFFIDMRLGSAHNPDISAQPA